MIMKNFTLYLLAAVSLILSLPSQAQQEPRKAHGRLAYFVCTGIPKDLENPVNVQLGKKVVQLQLLKRMASKPVKIPADGIIRIVRKSQDPEQSKYTAIAQTKIPEGINKALVILTPLKTPKNGIIFNTEVQDLKSFSGGDYLYLNLSPVNIAVDMGNQKIGIKPSSSKTYHSKSLSKSTNIATRYSYYHPKKKKWKILSASTVVLRPTRREICVFSWDDRLQRVDYHGVTFPVE